MLRQLPHLRVLCLLWLAGFLPLGTAHAGGPRPNIVFILADDLGYGDLGCYGQKHIRTPNLDRLALGGTRFTSFYAGATVCAPSRSTLMQGLHTGHCRVRGNAGKANPLAQALRPDDLTVARVLKDAGYATGLIGKWGLGDAGAAESGLPRRQGFDEFFGYLNQRHAHNYYPTFLWRNETRVPLRNTVPNEDDAGAGRSDNRREYSADRIADEALAFVRRHPHEPFFLLFTPTLPHANNEAGREGMEIPELGEYANLEGPPSRKAHAAMVSRLDRDVGRLLDLLEELHLQDNTLVFFTSDNGPHREGGNDPELNDSNGPFRGIKRDLYEGGIRVPMIVRWPGKVPADRVDATPWWFPDFLPTAATLAGVEPPGNLDGRNVLPLLLGQRAPRRSAPFYWEFHEGGFKQAIREGRWKAIRQAPGRTIELYNLDADPSETRDLTPSHPRTARRLARLLDSQRTDSPDWPVNGR
jgi:arylsulfatase A-like enzyme